MDSIAGIIILIFGALAALFKFQLNAANRKNLQNTDDKALEPEKKQLTQDEQEAQDAQKKYEEAQAKYTRSKLDH